MTTEKLNRLAYLSCRSIEPSCPQIELEEFNVLLQEWKNEQNTKFDIRKLKLGDIILHEPTGCKFLVMRIDEFPIAILSRQVENPTEWSKIND